MSCIEQNLNNIRARIQKLSTREVKLVAVSKFVELARIKEAISYGQKVFGENYVQEAARKFTDLLDQDLELHFIGSLQSNKAKEAVGLFTVIQSVDRLKLAEAIANRAAQKGIKQKILLQINISREDNKSGVLPENLSELLKELLKFDSLDIQGLMTIGDVNIDNRVKEFTEMQELYNLAKQIIPKINELSMGMSEDFELAISHGASIIRVGTAIFGERQ